MNGRTLLVFKPTYRPTSTGSFIGAFKPPDISTASHNMEKAYLPQKEMPVATKNNSAHEEFADAEDHMDLEVTLVETSPSYCYVPPPLDKCRRHCLKC